jgi:hypothetical protein
MGSGGIAPRILELGTRWEWLALHSGRFTTRGRAPRYPLDTRLVGPRAGLDAVDKRNIPSPRRESNSRTPIIQPGDSPGVKRPGRGAHLKKAQGHL